LDVSIAEPCLHSKRHAQNVTLSTVAVTQALTGYGAEEDIAASRHAGFDDHLVKPIEPQRLLQMLANLPASSAGPVDKLDALKPST
jgi:CheY-like chemotaxis protein